MIATSIRNGSMTAVINGKVYTVSNSHPNWSQVMRAVENGNEQLVVSLMNIPKAINKWFSEGNVTVRNGEVFYSSKKLGGVVVDRILEFMSQDLPVKPMIRFINNLMSNPSARAVQELYTFLEHKNMPITNEGNFLAYKGIQTDYFSCTAGDITVLKGRVVGGRIFNGVGEEIEVRRNEVDDNKENHCSKGIHAGSLSYATGFGPRTVIVEINPRDVVSIPSDCSCQKLRTCKYKVIANYVAPLDSTYQKPVEVVADTDDELGTENDYDKGYRKGQERYEDGLNNYVVDRVPEWKWNQFEEGFVDGYEDAEYGTDE